MLIFTHFGGNGFWRDPSGDFELFNCDEGGLCDLFQDVHSVSTLLGIYSTYWSSAAVTFPLSGLARCVFSDALLHTTVGMCGYFCVTVTLLSALTSLDLLLRPLSLPKRFCPQNCCSLDVFLFSHVMHENLRRSAISEIFKPPCLAPTIIPSSKSLRSHFFPIHDIWSEKQLNHLKSVCMLLLIYLLPHDWLIKYLH